MGCNSNRNIAGFINTGGSLPSRLHPGTLIVAYFRNAEVQLELFASLTLTIFKLNLLIVSNNENYTIVGVECNFQNMKLLQTSESNLLLYHCPVNKLR